MLGQSYAMKWVQQMASRDNVLYVARARISKDTKERLAKKGFTQSKEDYQIYLRTAATARACIVTYDPHYLAVRPVVKKYLDVDVCDPATVCDCLADGGGRRPRGR